MDLQLDIQLYLALERKRSYSILCPQEDEIRGEGSGDEDDLFLVWSSVVPLSGSTDAVGGFLFGNAAGETVAVGCGAEEDDEEPTPEVCALLQSWPACGGDSSTLLRYFFAPFSSP